MYVICMLVCIYCLPARLFLAGRVIFIIVVDGYVPSSLISRLLSFLSWSGSYSLLHTTIRSFWGSRKPIHEY
ncbi:hypothetical protein F5X98DRAFT_341221 [Xylaria grammica]|nr:hypothetical protein F5X98DRAFT_341221 [Xylaria grammica]